MKIGTTSWLVPGTYLENVKLVANKVDFVELLVFTWDKDTREILKREIEELHYISQLNDLEYTVHLPTDNICNVNEALDFFENSKLNISNYIVHPLDGVETILEESKKIAVENLKNDILIHDRTVFDIGHHFSGMHVNEKFLKNAIEFHIMGFTCDKDHLKLDIDSLNISKSFMKFMPNLEYICFEVFNLNDFLYSLKVWSENQ